MNTLQMKNRLVGSVGILELVGELTARNLGSVTPGFENFIRESSSFSSLLIDAQRLTMADQEGIEGLSDLTEKFLKKALIPPPAQSPHALIKELKKAGGLHLVGSEYEAANFFKKELVEEEFGSEGEKDRRRFPRLEVALPLQFICEIDSGRKLVLFAVATNLSESGLYAKFLGTPSENLFKAMLNPYDLKMLGLELYLEAHERIALQGKLIHRSALDYGVGVEFYDLEPYVAERLKNWPDRKTIRQ